MREELNRLADRVSELVGISEVTDEMRDEIADDLRALAARGAVPEGWIVERLPNGDLSYGDGSSDMVRASKHSAVGKLLSSMLAAAPQAAVEGKRPADPLPNWCRTCGRLWSDPLGALCSDVIHRRRKDAKPPEPAPSAPSIYDAYMTWPEDIRKKLSIHDLRRMDGWTPRPNPKGWAIDTSAGRPILVHEKCSVIEAETARYVLDLICRDAERAPSATAAITPEREAMSRMKHGATRLHAIVYTLAGKHQDIPELQDDGLLHKAVHEILAIDTPGYVPGAHITDATDAEIEAWATRHGFDGWSATGRRAAFEDAQSWIAPEPACSAPADLASEYARGRSDGWDAAMLKCAQAPADVPADLASAIADDDAAWRLARLAVECGAEDNATDGQPQTWTLGVAAFTELARRLSGAQQAGDDWTCEECGRMECICQKEGA